MVADLRVLIVAHDPLARAGLATLLADQPGCAVVGRVASEDDLLAAVEIYRPDVLLWDLGWDPAAAVDRLSELGEINLPVAVLLSDEVHVLKVWSAGVRALLRRDATLARLAAALAAVAQGLVTVDPAFVATLLPDAGQVEVPGASGRDRQLGVVEELTPRELEVLRLMAEGLPNKTIALRLGISEHTVKFHVNAILGKLGVASRTEAVVQATRLGLILL